MHLKNIIWIFIILFLIPGFKSHAQIGEKDFLYANVEIQLGNYLGIHGGLNYTLKEKYTFQVGIMGGIRGAKNKPVDYSGGLGSAFVLGLDAPKDIIEDYHFMFGKMILLKSTQKVRFNIQAGLAYTRHYEPYKYEKLKANWITPNYSFEYREFRRMSFIFNPVIEFPLSHWRGFNISPILHINKERISYLIGLGGIIGYVRKRNADFN